MIDFHDPTIQVETAIVSPTGDIPLVDPATARRFAYLTQAGAVAHLDRLGAGGAMTPDEALSAVEATIGRDGGRQVVIQPRRGTPFVIPLHRDRHGLVGQMSWT